MIAAGSKIGNNADNFAETPISKPLLHLAPNRAHDKCDMPNAHDDDTGDSMCCFVLLK